MLSRKMKGTLTAGLLAAGLAVSAATAQAATFAVNNDNNGGPGSLRSAIKAAEGTAAEDVITFDIPGAGPHTITPATPLPTITRPLTIDGYSEPGASEATVNRSAEIMIIIDAGNVARGLDIGGDDIEVRGLNIQDAQSTGVFVEGSDNIVAGNHIGTGVAGAVAIPNGNHGVQVFGQNNRIGGPAPADRNVLAGHLVADVFIDSGSRHVVEGNRIGTTAGGASALGGTVGVLLDGTATEVRGNLISGENNGVQVTSDDNVVQGNLIGTDEDGDDALPNFHGVNVVGGDRNLIGGPGEGEGNVVSGNDASGVQITTVDGDVARANRVEGNLIGITDEGDTPLGNDEGVLVHESDANTIEANVIAASADDGVRLDAADSNVLRGNWIGTDGGAGLDLGNGGSGVDIDGSFNRVGESVETGSMNTIVNNGDDGVTVTAGAGNAIVRNAIFDNTGLAIDLGGDGATSNDPDDADDGPNVRQNGPEISGADATSVDWTLDSEPTTSYRLEFYANAACSGASVTEAQTYLGSQIVTTDANGNADGSTVTAIAAGAGVHVSMTATKLFTFLPGLPPALRSTSEVSPCEATS